MYRNLKNYFLIFIFLLSWSFFSPVLCEYAETFTHTFPAGYNLFSLPFTPTVKSINSLGIENTQIFAWDAQNKKFLTAGDNFQLEPGKGYWLWLNTAKTISLEGTALTSDFTIPLKIRMESYRDPFN